jgi:hypothetical protein
MPLCRQSWVEHDEQTAFSTFNVTVHRLFNEPSRASFDDLVDDAFAGGSVSESCELSGEGRGSMKDEV